jgi:hypothetical protein
MRHSIRFVTFHGQARRRSFAASQQFIEIELDPGE